MGEGTETIREWVKSERFTKVLGTLAILAGLSLFVYPYFLGSGVGSRRVFVFWFAGGFLLVAGALFTSDRTPTGNAIRFQG